MKTETVTALSKKLSWLLRHGANEEKLPMDAAGWSPIDDVVRKLGISRAALDVVVRENNKSRLEVDGDRIRACQGHSLAGTPVTLDALEASWEAFEGAGPVWHGTSTGALAGIARGGILPVERTHVHLAEATDSTVGKRANVDVMLEVSVGRLRDASLGVYRSPNGVLLVRRVPPGCITGLRAMVARARREEAALRATLGL